MIYLDYIATTPVDPEVKGAMEPYWSSRFGNPSSIYALGQEAVVAIDESRDKLASFLGCAPEEIYFTGSATEADNLAIRGIVGAVARNWKLKISNLHVITTAIEHKAVLKPLEHLEKQGLQVAYLKPDRQGLIKSSDIAAALQENTILISIMAVNNEIGSILLTKDIFNLIQNERKQRYQKANKLKAKSSPRTAPRGLIRGYQLPLYFHSDAVQAAQFYNLNIEKLGFDLLTLSAHKIYGPKGIGALYVKQGTVIEPLIFGGGQEAGLRSGTENVPYVVGFGKAVELVRNQREKTKKKLKLLQKKLWDGIVKKVTEVELVGPPLGDLRVLNNVSLRVKGVSAESLIIACDQEGLAIASGSACTTGTVEPSHVLLAMGYDHKKASEVIRLSLGRPTGEKEISEFLEIFPELVKRLRR
jgi:cysteine desulfurase